ncbi:hypothetical protein APS56_11980 [Pseudalgibacter alginicilyticus]|uniref:Uncharacterized protein n=2 Tax=Pseudalgibacter alginicilyticus TaxID=1736674 RepID=A0A0P0DCR6_9FLAO|nr:hypothetical protein APS56_11980 [Pseudalgibacter alginicilyticus]
MVLENIEAIHFKPSESVNTEQQAKTAQIKKKKNQQKSSNTKVEKPINIKDNSKNNMKNVLRIKNLLVLVLPLIFGFVSALYTKTWFKWLAFIYAILFVLLNFAHAGEQIALGANNFTQVLLLLFVAGINVALIVFLNKWRKLI